jgi:hypothetical protein
VETKQLDERRRRFASGREEAPQHGLDRRRKSAPPLLRVYDLHLRTRRRVLLPPVQPQEVPEQGMDGGTLVGEVCGRRGCRRDRARAAAEGGNGAAGWNSEAATGGHERTKLQKGDGGLQQ